MTEPHQPVPARNHIEARDTDTAHIWRPGLRGTPTPHLKPAVEADPGSATEPTPAPINAKVPGNG